MADEFRAQGPFDELYDVPFTTAQTSTIKGGNAINTVPAECSFQFEFRNLPTLDPEPSSAHRQRTRAKRCCRRCSRSTRAQRSSSREIASAPGLDAIGTGRDHATRARAHRRIRRSARSHTARKRACSRSRACRASCAGRATSSRRTRRTNTSSLEQLAACEAFLGKFIHSMSVDAHVR